MSFPVVITLAVSGSLDDATVVADTAQQAGAVALRLLDDTPGATVGRVIDPSIAAAFLAGRQGRIGYLVDVPTSHQTPYNTARRVLSIDRATDGQAGVVLRPGTGDEVSDAVARRSVGQPAPRWSEYAEILTRLWDSFPRSALVGDQENAVVADDSAIEPIGHAGDHYRVAGPLDGPSSRQGRPVLVAADPETVGWDRLAAVADVVLVPASAAAQSVGALAAAAERVRRPRREVALLGRVEVDPTTETAAGTVAQLTELVETTGLDGLEVVPEGDLEAVLSVIGSVVTELADPPDVTLRASFGLVESVERLRA